MIYVDSNVFIYPVIYNKNVDGVLTAKKYLLKIAKGRLKSCTASLTWDELVWVVRKISDSRTAVLEGKKFLEFPYLQILDVNINILQKAQDLLREYNLRPRDAIHAGTAMVNDITEIISDDEDFDRIKGLKRIPIR